MPGFDTPAARRGISLAIADTVRQFFFERGIKIQKSAVVGFSGWLSEMFVQPLVDDLASGVGAQDANYLMSTLLDSLSVGVGLWLMGPGVTGLASTSSTEATGGPLQEFNTAGPSLMDSVLLALQDVIMADVLEAFWPADMMMPAAQKKSNLGMARRPKATPPKTGEAEVFPNQSADPGKFSASPAGGVSADSNLVVNSRRGRRGRRVRV